MCDQKKFTIVIPTRDRGDTLVHTLASALSQDYDNFVVLVSDNASNDNTHELVSKLNDDRIQYINTGRRLSMSQNWEFALNHVHDGWITILGDDDAILPAALKTVNKIIDETGTLAIRSNGCSYSWPRINGGQFGKLTISLKRGYRTVRSQTALENVMYGKSRYTTLPVLYNGGFVHASLIDRARSVTGRFFLSMVPDVYSAIVFAFLTDEYIYSDAPLAINGASHHSGGTAMFEAAKKNRHYCPIEKFLSEDNIPFHKDVPLLAGGRPVRSIPAVVYESFLQATPFHTQKELNVSPEQQLCVILRNVGLHADEVLEWGAVFAEQHQLDYDKLLRKVGLRKQKLINRLQVTGLRIQSLLSNWTVNGNHRVPLSNVYEASILSGQITANIPKPLLRVVNSCRRAASALNRK